MRKLLWFYLFVSISASLGNSADLQINDGAQWNQGEFNGTFYNNTGNLVMGYDNKYGDSLDALWRMEADVSSSGGELTDYSSNGFNAVAYGVETASKGILSSNAVKFDGSGDYLAIKDKKYSSSGQIKEITVCGWVKSSDSNGEYGNFIASFDRSEYWRFSFEDDSSGDHIAWDTTGSGGNVNDLSTSKSYADGKWHHVCGWYDADSNPSKQIFVDGLAVASVNAHGGNGLGTGATRYGFIGAGSEASSFNGDQGYEARFNGSIDELRIHDRALSDLEINNSYFNGVEGNFTGSYFQRYSNNFITDEDNEWRQGELTNLETIDGILTLKSLVDVKSGTFTAGSGNWKEINYPNFNSPVVVATVENTGNGNGLISEVSNVDKNTASIRVCDSNGRGNCEASSNHKIHYLAVDADSVNQVDGIEAGTFNINGEFTSTSQTVNYGESFTNAPVPFTTVQTVAGTPGVEARLSSFGTGSFTGGICQQDSQDACNGGHTTEKVGWIAIEPGNNPLHASEIGKTGTVNGDSNWNTQSFSTLENPIGLVSGLSENGGQEVQIDEVRNIQNSQMDVRYCEIESGDSCDTHTEENLGWLALEPGEYSLDSTEGFKASGTYDSKVFDAGKKVYWKKASLKYSNPPETGIDTSYGINSSGEWKYYSRIPKNNFSRYLKFNFTLSGNNSATPEINSLDIRYSGIEDASKWQTLTTDADVRRYTDLEAKVKAINYTSGVLGEDSVNIVSGKESYSFNVPASEDLEVILNGKTDNISNSWSLRSFNISGSICDQVSSSKECIMNQNRVFSGAEYSISQIFISEPEIELKSNGDTTTFNITESAVISSIWTGQFRIKSDSVRVEPGAKFNPEDGRIIIGR